MIQDVSGSARPPEDLRLVGAQLRSVRRLPHPLYLLEASVGSQHYHFGTFEEPGESVRRAQDRLAAWRTERFGPGAEVLDIGCGLGGTSRLLAALDLRVTGLDPCREALAYARRSVRLPPVALRPRFLSDSLEEYARGARQEYDGAFAIEVLQHFADLSAFFGACRRLLRPGGLLVLHDLCLDATEVPWPVPFHRRGEILLAGLAAGFQALEVANRGPAVRPTLPRMAAALEGRRASLAAAFPGRDVEAELAQVLGHMRALQSALERGDLSYHSFVMCAGPGGSTPCA